MMCKKGKLIIFILIFLFSCSCLFAERWFVLAHDIEEENGTINFQFWAPNGTSSSDSISDQSIQLTESDVVFSRIGMHYKGKRQISLSLGYSELINTSNSNFTCPYSLSILRPGTETAFDVSGDNTYSLTKDNVTYTMIDLINGSTLGVYKTEGNSSIADLKISYTTESLVSGTYQASLILICTEGSL